MNCCFCENNVLETGYVDIGGLKLCVKCYETRKNRTHIPCEICKEIVPVKFDPLIISQICYKCDSKANLIKKYEAAKK